MPAWADDACSWLSDPPNEAPLAVAPFIDAAKLSVAPAIAQKIPASSPPIFGIAFKALAAEVRLSFILARPSAADTPA